MSKSKRYRLHKERHKLMTYIVLNTCEFSVFLVTDASQLANSLLLLLLHENLIQKNDFQIYFIVV